MNSASRNMTVRLHQNSIADYIAAFRTAQDLFEKVEIASFLPPHDHPHYLEILSELVRLELARSWTLGKPIALAFYQARYPDLFANAALVYKIVVEEFRLRRQAGERPTPRNTANDMISTATIGRRFAFPVACRAIGSILFWQRPKY